MPVSAEGRVEHQKQNQTATFQWPVGFVFGVQLDYSCRKKSVPPDAENRVLHVFETKFWFTNYIKIGNKNPERESASTSPLGL